METRKDVAMRLVATDVLARYDVVGAFRLPFHAGSLLRGVIGRSLRAAGCARRPACEMECEARYQCTYARFFDPPGSDPPAHAFLRGQTRVPQPLIPIFPEPGQVHFEKGQKFSIPLRILGLFRPGEFEILLAALEGVSGFELGPEGGIVAFQGATMQGRREAPIAVDGDFSGIKRVQVVFETPAWLEFRGRLMETITFQNFFRSIYRRLTVLCALYGVPDDGDGSEFSRLDGLAESIAVVEQDVKALIWQRRSLARERDNPMQGIIGRVVFEGRELGAFLPVLRLAEKTHIGKATSHGLGRIRIEV